MAAFVCSMLFLMLFCGRDSYAKETYTNVWAVKVLGSQREAEELAIKYGFSYDRHVSQICFTLLQFAAVVVSFFFFESVY